MTPVRLFVILAALFTLSCRAPAENPQPSTSSTPAQPRRPNIVFVLVDDMRWDDLRVGGHPFIETPHMDRLASEGARFTNAFATTPLVLAEPRQLPDRPVPAHQRHHRQHRAAEPQPAGLSKGAAARRLSHRVLRQVAHGQRRQPPPRLRSLGRDAGSGRGGRPVAQRRWEARTGEGLHHRPAHRLRRALHRSALGQPFLVYLAHKAIHPNVIQQDDGSLKVLDGQPGGFVAADRHRGRYTGRACRDAPNAFVPPVDKPALWRQIDRLRAARQEHRDDRRRDPRPPRDAARRRRQPWPHRRGARAQGHPRRHDRRVHERPWLLLRRARPQRGTAAGLRGDDPHSAHRALSAAGGCRFDARGDGPQHRPGADAARRGGVAPPAGIQGRSLVPLLTRTAKDWRSAFLIEYFSDTVFPRIRNMGYSAVRTSGTSTSSTGN